MKLDYENSIKLYHYCTEIADALRSVLNNKQFDNIDPSYWISSLTNFEQLLKTILETPLDNPIISYPNFSNINEIRK